MTTNTRIRIIARPNITGTYISTYPTSGLVNVRWDDRSIVMSIHHTQIEAI
jgi:hypothetical protein